MSRGNTWPPARIDELCAHIQDNKSSGQIADAMGISRSAVMGAIHRLKKAGDQRVVKFGGENPVEKRREIKRQRMDDLAELVANGAHFITAGASLGLSEMVTRNTWSAIRAGLGWQAC